MLGRRRWFGCHFAQKSRSKKRWSDEIVNLRRVSGCFEQHCSRIGQHVTKYYKTKPFGSESPDVKHDTIRTRRNPFLSPFFLSPQKPVNVENWKKEERESSVITLGNGGGVIGL